MPRQRTPTSEPPEHDGATNNSTCLDTSIAQLTVIGVGGGGGNAVGHMLNNRLDSVRCIASNTDTQALENVPMAARFPLGAQLTQGLGAGTNPNIGYEAAQESKAAIKELLADTDMLFITAGMGGGTGTGASPVIAEISRSMGILTVAVVTRPFSMEGKMRSHYADQGIEALKAHVDSLIVVPNDRLLPVLGRQASLLTAFAEVNNVLLGAVAGITKMVTSPGLINVDFADVKAVLSMQGHAKVGAGIGHGDNRAQEAALAAINSPLLEHRDVQGAKGVLVNITGGLDVGLGEFNEVGEIVQQIAGDDATIIIGTSLDEDLDGALRVSVVAAGLPDVGSGAAHAEPPKPERRQSPQQQPASPNSLTANQEGRPQRPTSPPAGRNDINLRDLDIPAFLRRDVG